MAQIIPDSSLGAENSVVDSDGNRDTINGGAIRNANLFHSFQEFNVGAGKEAYFTNPNGIDNIFSRVTGNNISDIQGVLGVLGNANLYLINPNGILFGENARLDVNGSFFATTADSVVFGNGFEFSAANPNQPPLLTIDIPIGLRFRDNPGDITVRGNGNGERFTDSEVIDTQEALRVGSDKTIGLVGGNLFFEDATIKTAGGRIEIGSVARGEVDLVEVANGFTVDYSGVEIFEDISLSGRSIVDASGVGGGDIQVAGNNISITGVSRFIAHTLGSNPGGDINILATDTLEISGVDNEFNFASSIANRVFPNGKADGGDINIETGSLHLGDRALINTSLLGQGNAGDININASESISLESQGNTSAISSSVAAGAIGNGGNINITTPSLSLSNGAFFNANTSGQGNAGNITINARDISFDGQVTGFFTNVRTAETLGNGGNINITTGSLTISNGASLNGNTSGQGNAGNITINATNSVLLNGSSDTFTSIAANVGSSAIGNGGDININTGLLTVTNQAFFNANTSGQGNTGNITINASDRVSFDGQNNTNGLFTNVGSSAIGNAGNIQVNTGSLTVSNGARLSAGNSGLGKGGSVIINTDNDISFSNSSRVNVVSGEGGSITINARNLTIDSGSLLSAGIGSGLGFPDAQGGDIVINATEDISLNGGDIDGFNIINIVGRDSIGKTGKIDITAQNMTFTNGRILSLISGQGNTGDITLTAKESIAFGGSFNSGIFSFTEDSGQGNLGSISITSPNLSLTDGGRINSLSSTGNSGDINISANNVFIDGEDPKDNVLTSSIVSGARGTGDAGDIVITTDNLTLTNGGRIFTSNLGQGNAGDLKITANNIIIDGQGKRDENVSLVASNVLSEGKGNGGEINITTGSLLISNGGSLSTTTNAQGDVGNITINAINTVSVTGESAGFRSQISAAVLSDGVGNGGSIEINTTKFSIDRGNVTTFNAGQGDAGNITINARDHFVVNGGLITSNIGNTQGATALGKVGNIFIEAREVSFTDTAQIQAGFFSRARGESGIIFVKAEDSISFTGENIDTGERTGIFSNTEAEATGDASDIQLSAPLIFLGDGAVLFADNAGEGNGGNINVNADELQMNRGRISAATASGTGGEIQLQIADNLTLRNNSLISARAINNANGGNIDIDTEFIIAFPNQNNDIIASAEEGTGGNIDITAEAIFGIQEREATASNRTNDLDASSEFGLSGEVSIEQPDVDPASGLVELTQEVVDASKLIAQNVCTQTANSEFVDIGKGGLPKNPDDVLAEDTIEVGLVAPVTASSAEIESNREPEEVKPRRTRKPPAQGWIWHEDGTVELVAYNPNQAGEQRTWDNHRGCK